MALLMGPLSLGHRPAGATLTHWMCEELRRAILDGRLRRGVRLPGTRQFAAEYRISRRTAITVYEQLQAEGYLRGVHGSGTIVNDRLPEDLIGPQRVAPPPKHTSPRDKLHFYDRPAKPFRPIEPAVSEFPMELWARVSSRRMRRASPSLLAGGTLAGYRPLREAVATYLGSSRGVSRTTDEIIIVSGVQQALDLVARVIIRPGDKVWIEDPGYSGAVAVLRRAGADLVPVKVDKDGFDPRLARSLVGRARAAYVTPAHQFVLGATMPVERRLALLSLARECGAYVIEDDYDSEFRFEGRPVPALQSLDRADSVIYVGSFNKVLFPSLRLGYIAAPPALVDALLTLRYQADRYPPGLSQAVLCDFIVEGHFGRHLRRMRELYATRLNALHKYARRYLLGVVDIPRIEAGLNTPAHLLNGMTSKQACAQAAEAGIESMPLDEFALHRRDLRGLLLGFAAFTDLEIRNGIIKLATILG